MPGKQRTKDKGRQKARLPLPAKTGGAHKSKKEYDRKRDKNEARQEIAEDGPKGKKKDTPKKTQKR